MKLLFQLLSGLDNPKAMQQESGEEWSKLQGLVSRNRQINPLTLVLYIHYPPLS